MGMIERNLWLHWYKMQQRHLLPQRILHAAEDLKKGMASFLPDRDLFYRALFVL
jgi:Leu/Phe-tRNA-protein transferase